MQKLKTQNKHKHIFNNMKFTKLHLFNVSEHAGSLCALVAAFLQNAPL